MAQQEKRDCPAFGIGQSDRLRGPGDVCVCITFISCTASYPSLLLCGIRGVAQPGDLTDGTSLSHIDLGGLA